jgi:hypothetical protein
MGTGESGGEPPHSKYASLVGKIVGLRGGRVGRLAVAGGRADGIYAADAEASLGWGGGGEWGRAKAVASHRTPNTLPWLGRLWGFAGGSWGVVKIAGLFDSAILNLRGIDANSAANFVCQAPAGNAKKQKNLLAAKSLSLSWRQLQGGSLPSRNLPCNQSVTAFDELADFGPVERGGVNA